METFSAKNGPQLVRH